MKIDTRTNQDTPGEAYLVMAKPDFTVIFFKDGFNGPAQVADVDEPALGSFGR